MSTYRRDLSALARATGWRITKTRGGHVRLTHPDVPRYVIASYSPRNGSRALIQTRAELRRQMQEAAR